MLDYFGSRGLKKQAHQREKAWSISSMKYGQKPHGNSDMAQSWSAREERVVTPRDQMSRYLFGVEPTCIGLLIEHVTDLIQQEPVPAYPC